MGETQRGQWFVWGSGGCGQLGLGSLEDQSVPQALLSSPPSVRLLVGGPSHTLALTGKQNVSSPCTLEGRATMEAH